MQAGLRRDMNEYGALLREQVRVRYWECWNEMIYFRWNADLSLMLSVTRQILMSPLDKFHAL